LPSARSLAFADLSGNRQYVSVGNLSQNDRTTLILMDYPNRRRLKIRCSRKILIFANNFGLTAASSKISTRPLARYALRRAGARRRLSLQSYPPIGA
jgi:predicted pyridoxine 5'-phosphate oxidase superfamily flavin-nucleotide-binding protein